MALLIDGVHFADHLCVVALGIGLDGTKYPLGVAAGDTENTTVVRDLLAGLRERGLPTTQPILCVLDGAKARVAGVKAVFDQPVFQRCQLHKIRNVESKLPKALAASVGTRCVLPTLARTLRSTNAVESMAVRRVPADAGRSWSLVPGSPLIVVRTVRRALASRVPGLHRSNRRLQSQAHLWRALNSNVPMPTKVNTVPTTANIAAPFQ